jgi:peptide/nickel transport system substrate-binding protein
MRTTIYRHMLLCTAATALVACAESGSDGGEQIAVSSPRNEAVVLLSAEWGGTWPAGLDPATNTTARANLSQMNAIFGGLFQLADAGDGFELTGVLAKSYEVIDEGRTIVIRLREGVRFSDGTPLDAEAVKYNIVRNLGKPCTCSPSGWPWSEGSPVTVLDSHTVALHFTRPYAAVMHAFPGSNVNWIASPTAIRQMGEEQFRMTPVGAGPFNVVSNQLSTRLVLERNPDYWEDGKPHLDRLIFQSIGSEQAAYQALLAGDAHAFEGMTSTALIAQAQQDDRLVVTQQPATSPYVIQLNTARAPFDDKRAREAIYYATNVDAIREGLFHNWYPLSQTFTGPGGLFHHPRVDGYRVYDLERARTIVAELGGLNTTLGTLRSFVAEQVVTALQTQWRQAGIEVSIATHEIAPLIERFQSGNWHAMLQTAGSYDPEAGASVSFRFRSDQRYTGVRDPNLDRLLDQAAGTFDPAERDRAYAEASEYISDQAYAPFLFAFAPTQVAVRGLQGPGLTTLIPPIFINTGVLWQDVRFTEPGASEQRGIESASVSSTGQR